MKVCTSNYIEELYKQRQERIKQQLASIETLLERHDTTSSSTRRWDHAGDLGEVKTRLEYVEIFLRRSI